MCCGGRCASSRQARARAGDFLRRRFLTDTCRQCNRIGNCYISVTKEKFLGRKAMSQNGRREFLTSAAAVAAALAACSAPARRAQAQPACVTMYDEQGIVHIVAQAVQNTAFLNQLITFPAGTTPAMANLTPQFVNNTLTALSNQSITTVRVKRGTNVPLGTYDLIPLGTTPAPPFKRSPVVLSLDQYRAHYEGDHAFSPDWSRILMFVIPTKDAHGNPTTTPGGAESAMCAHPFGM
jgi:hypothetical protein